MKKLFSLILMALISSQMWAAVTYTTKIYVVGINGSTYTKSTTEGTYGEVSAASFTSYSWNTSNKCYQGVNSSNTAKFTLTATPKTGYQFKGWYDGQYSSSTRKSSTNPYQTDRSTWSGTIYAHFEVATYTISISSEKRLMAL